MVPGAVTLEQLDMTSMKRSLRSRCHAKPISKIYGHVFLFYIFCSFHSCIFLLSFLAVSAASDVIPALFSLSSSLAALMSASAASVLVFAAAAVLITFFLAAQASSLEDNDLQLIIIVHEKKVEIYVQQYVFSLLQPVELIVVDVTLQQKLVCVDYRAGFSEFFDV